MRDYNPVIGKYIQADPIGQEGGPHLYVYVSNNPINLKDPKGLEECRYGRYVPCDNMSFLQRWICRRAVDRSCSGAGYVACCELEKTGCMGCAANECDETRRRAKEAACVNSYEHCMATGRSSQSQ
jgi:uncharacterized protein RhaS with RHS repeats